MSNLSTNGRSMLNNMDFQNHANSRPKFQPIRVKELLHFCESDDDESEDKVQDSTTELESDDPQSLSQDDSNEDDLNKSLPLSNDRCNSDVKSNYEVPQIIASAKSEESEEYYRSEVDNIVKYKTNNVVPEVHASTNSNYNNAEIYDNEFKDSAQDSHKTIWSINSGINTDVKCETTVSQSSKFHEHECNTKSEKNINFEYLNHVLLTSKNNHIQEPISPNEHKNTNVTNVNIKREMNEEQAYKSDLQSMDRHNTCKNASNSEFESIVFVSQHLGNVSQSGTGSLQNINMKETLDQKSTINEEKAYNNNISPINKSLTSDIGPLTNSVDHLVPQTPLKCLPPSSHPDPCFSHRNIIQTPQNKLSDISKNHRLTPATISSHWSHNNIKQTPLQNKSASFKDSMQTPKNTTYFTPSINRHESSRYLNTERKVRQPLGDTSSFAHNNVSNRRLIQGSQFSQINEVIPRVQNTLPNKSLNNKTSIVKQTSEVSKNVVQVESDDNDQLKENKYPNVEDKETITQNETINNKHVAHLSKNSKETLKSVSNESQNQYLIANNQNQQQQPKRVIDNASSIQFSMPSSISKSKQNKTILVKGKEYVILGTLGQGMSGEVLRVQDTSSLELCAIKCVNLNRMDKDSAQGCLEEISMLHKLQAPCIIKMFDYEIKYPMVYVVMEMGDTDLSRLLKTMSQEKHIPLTMILYYWTEMLTAVKHIHDNGVIHSDLKPANFLLVRGRLKLIDFGIASNMNADMTSVVKNCPIGTLNYISPEALMDIGGNSDSPTQNVKYKITFKSDVWSLGCILYSLVYGHTPFHHIRSQWAKVNAITNPIPNISFPTTLPSGEGDKVISAPPILIDVMRKCLQHDSKARPTVTELLQLEYVPTKQERMLLTSIPDIPTNILVKIKHSLNEDEWRQLTRVLENRRHI